ncbi:hypothetical protein GCM10011504_39180 [Siccirubricoccus deserti]|nr:hypothetical protein GCM10011504_39180 [Siccirubricoccus deserti]
MVPVWPAPLPGIHKGAPIVAPVDAGSHHINATTGCHATSLSQPSQHVVSRTRNVFSTPMSQRGRCLLMFLLALGGMVSAAVILRTLTPFPEPASMVGSAAIEPYDPLK